MFSPTLILTNDVEEVSIVNNNLNYNIAKKVATEGLPKLLKLYSKYEIRATFYFTGTFAKYFPEAVLEVLRQGSEVGCHGYSHLYSHAFDVMPIDQQYSHLLNAKKILEDIAGKIVSFRAPALRLNSNTVKILKHLDFNTDSSVAPQRFDGPLTSGSLNKLSWILSKRKPYFVGETLYKEGNSNLLEIPVSSFVFGYQGTTLRFSPNLNSIVESFLLSESKKNNYPLVFLFHPTEAVKEKRGKKSDRRSKTLLGYVLADKLRRTLKLKNLGPESLILLENLIKRHKDKDALFMTASDYFTKVTNKNET